MVTVNYGSGTPQLGAAWASWIVAHHAPVTEFNIVNEPYGCGEVNFPITTPPVNYSVGAEHHVRLPAVLHGFHSRNAADRAVCISRTRRHS